MPPGPSGDGAAGGHPGEGLPRARRIQKRPDFVRIQDSPVRVTTRHLLILLARAAGAPLLPEQPSTPRRPSRLGVVASRKVGPAVTRNRAKRLVRETFRRSGDTFPAGLDVVIIVRPSPRWGPRPPAPPAPPLLGLEELRAEVAGIAAVVARRARELVGRR